MDMNQAGSIFIDPNDGGPIGTDQLLCRGKMPEKAGTGGISPVERRNLLRPLCPSAAVVCEA
jgi:hypothetical protein